MYMVVSGPVSAPSWPSPAGSAQLVATGSDSAQLIDAGGLQAATPARAPGTLRKKPRCLSGIPVSRGPSGGAVMRSWRACGPRPMGARRRRDGSCRAGAAAGRCSLSARKIPRCNCNCKDSKLSRRQRPQNGSA
eukprot:357415-Chlamydomonas_euryale.AAC.8